MISNRDIRTISYSSQPDCFLSLQVRLIAMLMSYLYVVAQCMCIPHSAYVTHAFKCEAIVEDKLIFPFTADPSLAMPPIFIDLTADSASDSGSESGYETAPEEFLQEDLDEYPDPEMDKLIRSLRDSELLGTASLPGTWRLSFSLDNFSHSLCACSSFKERVDLPTKPSSRTSPNFIGRR